MVWILNRIKELRCEMERIYAVTNQMSHPDLLRVSQELDSLLVEYIEWEKGRPGATIESDTSS